MNKSTARRSVQTRLVHVAATALLFTLLLPAARGVEDDGCPTVTLTWGGGDAVWTEQYPACSTTIIHYGMGPTATYDEWAIPPNPFFNLVLDGQIRGHTVETMSDPPFRGGTIPDGIERLTKLEVLHVGGKGLEGTIPWGRLAKLRLLRILVLAPDIGIGFLYLPEGGALHGPALPAVDEMEEMKSLRHLQLAGNLLTGTLPRELGTAWRRVESMDFSGNELHGTLPSELGLMRNLSWFDARHTALTGQIPTQLGQCTEMVWLTLENNALTGQIPTQLGQCTEMVSLSLGFNALSGQIPTQLGQCTER